MNCGSYQKLGQPLLQNKAAITNWDRYYKLGQQSTSLQTMAISQQTQYQDIAKMPSKYSENVSLFVFFQDIQTI